MMAVRDGVCIAEEACGLEVRREAHGRVEGMCTVITWVGGELI